MSPVIFLFVISKHVIKIKLTLWVGKMRMKNAFKREKTHSLLHEHVLSGIVKCPVCGAPMYGVVNRKKKKGSEEFYTDMWYYICKNRKGCLVILVIIKSIFDKMKSMQKSYR